MKADKALRRDSKKSKKPRKYRNKEEIRKKDNIIKLGREEKQKRLEQE